MNTGRDGTTEREQRLAEAIAAFLEASDAGREPDRAAFLALNPDLTPDLEAFLAEHDRLRRLGAPLAALPFALDAPADGAHQQPAVGDRVRYVGDYELLRELARGGMGIVFEARQRSLGRTVALKMILVGAFADAAEVQRFQLEAEAVAQLDHPNIVPIYQIGTHDEHRYFSMRLVDGPSLARVPNRFRSDPRAAARIVSTVARAVHHAHQRGVLHRDLKPSNILLDAEGRPHVTDFGLAKRLGSDSDLTLTGAVLGTPGYMAPEQAAGRRVSITTATDVYGLGALLYALLTGEPPAPGESPAEVLHNVRTRDPAPPRIGNPNVERDLEIVCLKCLEKDPLRRYGSAEAVADDLERWLAGKTILARAVGHGERLWRWCRRNPLPAGLAVALVLLVMASLAGLSIGIALLWHEQGRTQNALIRAKQREAATHRQLYVARLNHLHRTWKFLSSRQIDELLNQLDPAPGEDDVRSFEWGYVRRLSRGSRRVDWQRDHGGGEVNDVRYSPDGQYVATASDDGTARVLDAGSGEVVAAIGGHGGDVCKVAFSPDGRLLATTSADGSARVWEWRSKRILHQFTNKQAPPYAVTFSPVGVVLAVGWNDGVVRFWDLPSVRERPSLKADDVKVKSLAFSPDGKYLASSTRSGRLWDTTTWRTRAEVDWSAADWWGVYDVAFGHANPLWVTATGQGMANLWGARIWPERGYQHAHGSPNSVAIELPVINPAADLIHRYQGHKDVVESVSISPDDRLLATGSRDGTIRLWDLQTGSLENVLIGHTGRVTRAEFSPLGGRLVSASHDRTVRCWYSSVRQDAIVMQRDSVSVGALSRDGRCLAVANSWDTDRRVRLWNDPGLSPQGTLPAGPETFGIALSGDGKLAATGHIGAVILWDVPLRRRLFTLDTTGEGAIAALAFTPDGRTLLTCGEWVRRWDVATGQERDALRNLQGHFTLSPDGGTLAAFRENDRELVLWDLTAGQFVVPPRRMREEGRCTAFSSEGSIVATGGTRGSITLWDARSGRELGHLLGHRSTIHCLAFSADGKTLASGSRDGAIKLWNLPTGQESLTLEEGTGEILFVAFTPDGKALITVRSRGERIGEVRRWLATDDLE